MGGDWYKTLIVISTTASLLALVGNFLLTGRQPGGTLVTLLTTFLAIAVVPQYLKRMRGTIADVAASLAEAAQEEGDPAGLEEGEPQA